MAQSYMILQIGLEVARGLTAEETAPVHNAAGVTTCFADRKN